MYKYQWKLSTYTEEHAMLPSGIDLFRQYDVHTKVVREGPGTLTAIGGGVSLSG